MAKCCPRCGEPSADWTRGASYCRPCMREYKRVQRLLNHEEEKRKAREYYRRSGGAAKRMEYYRADPDGPKKQNEQYYKHREKRLAALRAKRAANREESRAAWNDWRDRNRDHRAAYERRSSALRHYTPEATDYRDVLYQDPCSYCGGPAGSVDHIEPVRKGGGNEWENLTAVCKPCNTSKLADSLVGFLQRGGMVACP